jgi:hypothetical protein
VEHQPRTEYKKSSKLTRGQILTRVSAASTLGLAIGGAFLGVKKNAETAINPHTLGTPVSPVALKLEEETVHNRDTFAKKIAEGYLTATPMPLESPYRESVEVIKPAVVRIILHITSKDSSGGRTGEGVVVYNSGGTVEILTAGHVVDLRSSDYDTNAKIDKITLSQPQFSQEQSWSFPVTSDSIASGLDDGVDLGVITLHGDKLAFDNLPFDIAELNQDWTVSPIGEQKVASYQIPDVLVNLGKNLGEAVEMTTGSSFLTQTAGGQYLVDGNLGSGASGAPVVNERGEVIAVMSSSGMKPKLVGGGPISSFTPLSYSNAGTFLRKALEAGITPAPTF